MKQMKLGEIKIIKFWHFTFPVILTALFSLNTFFLVSFFLTSRTPLIYMNYIYQADLTLWGLFFAIVVNIYSYFKKK
jgi:hypothetical protein